MRAFRFIAATSAATLALLGFGATAAFADTETWDGGGAPDLNWSTEANWLDNADIDAGDDLIFTVGGSTNQNLGIGFDVNSMTFNAPFDVTGDQIDIVAGITASAGNNINLQTFLAVGTSQTFTSGSGSEFGISGGASVAALQELLLTGEGAINIPSALNGAAGSSIRTSNLAFLLLAGGGNIPTINAEQDSFVVFSAVYPAATVMAQTGAVVIGGNSTNTGSQQLVYELFLDDGGVISPGYDLFSNPIGNFVVQGGFSGDSSATYAVSIDGTASDRLVTDGFDTDETMLDLLVDNYGPVGTQYTIVEGDYDLTEHFTTDGTTILTDGATFEDANGELWRINYFADRVVLTYLQAVLPATGAETAGVIAIGAMLLIGGLVLVVSRRRVARG